MMMSLVVVTYMVRGSMTKALIMVGLGLVLVTVVMDTLSGRECFTYGLATLRDGIGITSLPLIPLWVKVLQISANLLSILILIFCFLGSYSINNIFDVIITFVFGVFGYLLKTHRFETPPLILAFVLGPLIEVAFRQTMIVSEGSFLVFAQRPICAFLMLVSMVIVMTALSRKDNSPGRSEVMNRDCTLLN
jgi:TctA family transporter